MYREKAYIILKSLLQLGDTPRRISFCDFEEAQIINAIANECKSTVIRQSKTGPKGQRYESSFTFDAVRSIIQSLVSGQNVIPKDIMNKAIFENGEFIGLNDDVHIYKGIDSETAKFGAYLGHEYIDDRDLSVPGVREAMSELIKQYARELILQNANSSEKYFPHISGFKLFSERLLHSRVTPFSLRKDYAGILSKYSGLRNKEMISNSAEYKINQITSSKFIQSILESIKNGTAISLLNDTSKTQFEKLQNQIAAEIEDRMRIMPNLSNSFDDINQIFRDAQTQLTAYTIDFRGLNPQEIEDAIKRINSISLTDKRSEHIGENGYRNCNVGLGTSKIQLSSFKDVPNAMHLLAQEIYSLVNSKDLSDEQYLENCTKLMYRFIRIHPFPDSNGRTSRALLNALTLNRNILVPFSKEDKNDFILDSNMVHLNIDSNYLQFLHTDSSLASQAESKAIKPLVDFVKSHSQSPTFRNPVEPFPNKEINGKDNLERE